MTCPKAALRARSRAILLLILAASFAVAGMARTEAPDALLEQTSRHMLNELKAHRDKLRAEPSYIYSLVEDVLAPHVDFRRASHWVLGRQNWREATPEQRARFVEEFKTLLIRFYSRALAEYLQTNEVPEGELMSFQPVRLREGERNVTVRSQVNLPSGASVPVDYHMVQTKQGWKVYDVTVEGVSMVSTYRSSFAAEIRNRGLDALIQQLAERNQRLLQGP